MEDHKKDNQNQGSQTNNPAGKGNANAQNSNQPTGNPNAVQNENDRNNPDKDNRDRDDFERREEKDDTFEEHQTQQDGKRYQGSKNPGGMDADMQNKRTNPDDDFLNEENNEKGYQK